MKRYRIKEEKKYDNQSWFTPECKEHWYSVSWLPPLPDRHGYPAHFLSLEEARVRVQKDIDYEERMNRVVKEAKERRKQTKYHYIKT
jgi:hypothetical protein